MKHMIDLQQDWKIQKAKLIKRFEALTEGDLYFEDGKKEEMLGRLLLKLGKSKEELRLILQSL
jgi:hypothetical protein